MPQPKPRTLPIADLAVERARRGDLEAFREVYATHVGRIHALSLRMTANPSLAEEYTQEVFVKAWRKLGSFRGEAAFSSWLHRVAVNTILDALKRERYVELPLVKRAWIPATTPAFELERAIAGLPDKARRVFVLHDIEGYTHEEIGEFMGTTAGTARGQLHRARHLLREVLS